MTPAQAKKLAEAADFAFYYSRDQLARCWVMYPNDLECGGTTEYFTAAVLRNITPERFAEVYLKNV